MLQSFQCIEKVKNAKAYKTLKSIFLTPFTKI